MRDASFEVRAGEIVGVAGLVGCGKSELALALGGAVRADGEIRVRSRRVRLRSPRAAIAAGIGLVPEDRKRSAILPTRSVQHNLSAAWGVAALARRACSTSREERRMAQASVDRFGVEHPSLATPIVQLSGGNQQKVVLGALVRARRRDVIVLSEPTRGIDVGAKSEVYRLIQDMAERGAGVLMISSELPELLGLCRPHPRHVPRADRGEFDAANATEEEIAAIALRARRRGGRRPEHRARTSGHDAPSGASSRRASPRPLHGRAGRRRSDLLYLSLTEPVFLHLGELAEHHALAGRRADARRSG